ncbi:MAG: iron chelate uptake ABC transporter family permease subunit [Micropruina sp.]|uniref:FecCD family ABC transporter permease n=1 Tax=Micropruina sp. TaxID=2737536 RepID=UPI0039E3C6EC
MTDLRPRPEAASAPITQRRSPAVRAVGLLVLLAALAAAVIVSLAVGARSIPPLEVLQILFGDRGGQNAAVVNQLRVPRTLIALVAGAALGVAGALIQAVTRNPLADPGILGVNAGAAFALAIGTGLLGISGAAGTLTLAYVGAFGASLLVYAIGSLGRGGASPVRLILAGVALGAVLAGITRAITLTDRARFAGMTAWESGSLLDRDAGLLALAAPLTVVGLGIALAIGSSLNAIALGDDLAAALGANVLRTRIFAVTAVMLLAGTATALAGPISFVGLMVPHAVRWIVGPDQRWIIGYSVVAAPTLLLLSDVLGRVAIAPGELPAGIVTALVGAPVLVFLVRQRKASEL